MGNTNKNETFPEYWKCNQCGTMNTGLTSKCCDCSKPRPSCEELMESEQNAYPNSVKITILSVDSTGKTSLALRAFFNSYDGDIWDPTKGDDIHKGLIVIDNQGICVEALDTSGLEQYSYLHNKWIRGEDTDGYILTYCPTYNDPLSGIQLWYDKILNSLDEDTTENIPMIIVGCRTDMKNQKITKKEIDKFAKNKKIPWIETSAKNDKNCKEAFRLIVREILAKKYNINVEEIINESTISEQWQCNNCTLINSHSAEICSVCESPKPTNDLNDLDNDKKVTFEKWKTQMTKIFDNTNYKSVICKINDLIDNAVQENDADCIITLSTELNEKILRAISRKIAFKQLMTIIFGKNNKLLNKIFSEGQKMKDVDHDNLDLSSIPMRGTVTREWLDIAINHITGPKIDYGSDSNSNMKYTRGFNKKYGDRFRKNIIDAFNIMITDDVNTDNQRIGLNIAKIINKITLSWKYTLNSTASNILLSELQINEQKQNEEDESIGSDNSNYEQMNVIDNFANDVQELKQEYDDLKSSVIKIKHQETIRQLCQFGYAENDIIKAIQKVNGNNDINNIIECIESMKQMAESDNNEILKDHDQSPINAANNDVAPDEKWQNTAHRFNVENFVSKHENQEIPISDDEDLDLDLNGASDDDKYYIGDLVEINSDPEDYEDIQSHIHRGHITKQTKDQITIKKDVYFIDEVSIKLIERGNKKQSLSKTSNKDKEKSVTKDEYQNMNIPQKTNKILLDKNEVFDVKQPVEFTNNIYISSADNIDDDTINHDNKPQQLLSDANDDNIIVKQAIDDVERHVVDTLGNVNDLKQPQQIAQQIINEQKDNANIEEKEEKKYNDENNIEQAVLDTMGRINDNDDDDDDENINGMDGPTKQFYNFLKENKLEKYFAKFKENECCDIRDIEYLDDTEFLKNDIGIKNPIHRKKLLGECKKLKSKMDTFKQLNVLPSVIIEKLFKHGIVTMNILCNEVANKLDLQEKFGINNDSQCNLIWNVIKIQLSPQTNNQNQLYDQEGM